MTRNDDLRKVAGNWTWPETGPHIREIKIRVYGKRQTSDSSLRFLKISNRYTKKVHNNSHVYGLHETLIFNQKWQMVNGK